MKNFFKLLLIALSLLGCSTYEPSQAGKGRGGTTLFYGIPQAPTSLDPAATTDLIYYQIVFNIFETLITVDWNTGQFLPKLAKSWHADSAGLHWTFWLREGVVFHDGSPLNAEAVKISIERQFNERSPYFQREVTDKYGHFAFGMLREIRALNDSMVQFILKYPYSAFLDNLATPEFASILSAHALEKFGANFGYQPVGTGPFQFVRWEKDRQIVIKKFPQYWGAPAQLDKVIYQIIPNLNRKIQTLQDGRLDVISGLSATSVDRLYRASGITVIANPILSTTFLGLNCQTYPFSQVNARRAVASALDKKSLVYSISRGLAAMAKGPLPPLAAYCDTTLTSPQYDPGAAKALLKNSGYTNDAILNLIYFIETDTLRANPMIQGFKAYLEKIGMKVNTMPYYDWQTYKQDILSGKSQLFWGGWKGYTRHPDNFLYPLFHSQSPHNLFKYRNSEVDRLLEEARQTSQVERQRVIYRRVQEIILRDCPAVFISYPTAVYAIRNRVKNFKVDPLAIPWLQEVRLE